MKPISRFTSVRNMEQFGNRIKSKNDSKIISAICNTLHEEFNPSESSETYILTQLQESKAKKNQPEIVKWQNQLHLFDINHAQNLNNTRDARKEKRLDMTLEYKAANCGEYASMMNYTLTSRFPKPEFECGVIRTMKPVGDHVFNYVLNKSNSCLHLVDAWANQIISLEQDDQNYANVMRVIKNEACTEQEHNLICDLMKFGRNNQYTPPSTLFRKEQLTRTSPEKENSKNTYRSISIIGDIECHLQNSKLKPYKMLNGIKAIDPEQIILPKTQEKFRLLKQFKLMAKRLHKIKCNIIKYKKANENNLQIKNSSERKKLATMLLSAKRNAMQFKVAYHKIMNVFKDNKNPEFLEYYNNAIAQFKKYQESLDITRLEK